MSNCEKEVSEQTNRKDKSITSPPDYSGCYWIISCTVDRLEGTVSAGTFKLKSMNGKNFKINVPVTDREIYGKSNQDIIRRIIYMAFLKK